MPAFFLPPHGADSTDIHGCRLQPPEWVCGAGGGEWALSCLGFAANRGGGETGGPVSSKWRRSDCRSALRLRTAFLGADAPLPGCARGATERGCLRGARTSRSSLLSTTLAGVDGWRTEHSVAEGAQASCEADGGQRTGCRMTNGVDEVPRGIHRPRRPRTVSASPGPGGRDRPPCDGLLRPGKDGAPPFFSRSALLRWTR